MALANLRNMKHEVMFASGARIEAEGKPTVTIVRRQSYARTIVG